MFLFRDSGTIVPLGKGVETGVNNPNGYTLNYNGTFMCPGSVNQQPEY